MTDLEIVVSILRRDGDPAARITAALAFHDAVAGLTAAVPEPEPEPIALDPTPPPARRITTTVRPAVNGKRPTRGHPVDCPTCGVRCANASGLAGHRRTHATQPAKAAPPDPATTKPVFDGGPIGKLPVDPDAARARAASAL